jgi:DNA-binding response OmpR family regulator
MSSTGTTILIVDDEENIRLMVRLSLESQGYFIREAISAREAIESIENECPDLVLLDLRMPGGHGMSVLEHLSQWQPERRPAVIVLTAQGRVSDAVQAMRMGAADFLEKPTTPEQLRLSVATALQDRRRKRASAQPPAMPQQPSHADVSYSQTLVRLQQSVWNGDIYRTEQVLAECLHKAANDPTYYNVLGMIFEAGGNARTAKTFYLKAQAVPGGDEAAGRNLQRLQEMELSGIKADIVLGDHAQFVLDLCSQPFGPRAFSGSAAPIPAISPIHPESPGAERQHSNV